MSTKTAQIRTAIKTLMETVPGIGAVHAYERYAKQASKFIELYQSGTGADKRVRGWNIRRINFSQSAKTTSRRTVYTTWEIKGFLGIDDEGQTEIEFDNLIEQLADAFAADETLGGAVSTTVANNGETAGLQLQDASPVLFNGVLCHSAKLHLTTIHYV